MNKLKWWLRIVGGFYLLLGVMNVLVSLFDPQLATEFVFPPSYTVDEVVVRTFIHANLPPTLAWIVLGVIMFYASRELATAKIIVLTVAMLELFTWVPYDVLWFMNGLPGAVGAPFLVIHVAIAVTGILFLRQAQAE